MLHIDFGRYKYLGLFAALNITFLLVSNFTAGRLVEIWGVGVSVTVLYFPVTYILADILTEVYGYAQARSILWLTMVCSVIAAVVVQLAILVPAAPFFTSDASYQQVFAAVPRIAIAGWVAVFSGDICNNYVLAKMKIWTKGRHLWARLIGSTIVGELVNTAVFYGIALYGILSTEQLIQGVLMGAALKTVFEIVVLPITYQIIRLVKKAEDVDYFDYKTDFNPFITDAKSKK